MLPGICIMDELKLIPSLGTTIKPFMKDKQGMTQGLPHEVTTHYLTGIQHTKTGI